MKVLVLGDIHANWPALSAIQEPFDACVCVGDLVDYGTDPSPCVEWVIRNATHAVRGNHDHAVAQNVAARGGPGFRELAAGTRPLQAPQLSAVQMKYLSRLPLSTTALLDSHRFALVHATPRDPLDEYLLNDADAWRQRLQHIQADFLCVGHTHVPYHLEVDGVRIINPGSVGQPRDGDPRASYAIVENGRVEFRRVAYSIDTTLEHMRKLGTDPRILRLTESVLRTGGLFPAETA